jgi:hypothetical protein
MNADELSEGVIHELKTSPRLNGCVRFQLRRGGDIAEEALQRLPDGSGPDVQQEPPTG